MHHANIIISERSCKNSILKVLIKELGFDAKANPDFWLAENQLFGIGDARELERWAINKPLRGGFKVFLIITKSITWEAQNALLKVLEEPPPGTYIFINLESLGGLLPTFISRVRILDLSLMPLEPEKIPAEGEIISEFLNLKIGQRFSLIHSFSQGDKKDGMKELIKNLEKTAYEKNFNHQDLRKILTAKILASARGSSPKMLLEWLSCML